MNTTTQTQTDIKKVLHRSDSRGFADHGWLKSFHSFSFAGYYNPERMRFGMLRVLNDDSVAGSEGFDTHPHQDMEIVSIPLSGDLKHEDSEGNKHVIHNGEVQIMSAGTGIYHSEYNASSNETVKFLQIWVLPKKLGIEPRYGQKAFDRSARKNAFQTVVSSDGRGGSLEINQDAFFSIAQIEKGQEIHYKIQKNGNGVYLFVLSGDVSTTGESLKKRDALGVYNPGSEISLKADSEAEVLVIEVPV